MDSVALKKGFHMSNWNMITLRAFHYVLHGLSSAARCERVFVPHPHAKTAITSKTVSSETNPELTCVALTIPASDDALRLLSSEVTWSLKRCCSAH